jgi:hypothetical protein
MNASILPIANNPAAHAASRHRVAAHRVKPRPLAGLFAKLTDKQQAELYSWLADERITYRAAAARLQSQLGVTTTEKTLSDFWHKYSLTLLRIPPPACKDSVKLQVVLRCERPLEVEVITEGFLR